MLQRGARTVQPVDERLELLSVQPGRVLHNDGVVPATGHTV